MLGRHHILCCPRTPVPQEARRLLFGTGRVLQTGV